MVRSCRRYDFPQFSNPKQLSFPSAEDRGPKKVRKHLKALIKRKKSKIKRKFIEVNKK